MVTLLGQIAQNVLPGTVSHSPLQIGYLNFFNQMNYNDGFFHNDGLISYYMNCDKPYNI